MLIKKRYQAQQKIGQGAQACILSGTDLKSKQAVAIKVVDVNTKVGKAAFINEALIQNKMVAKSKYICEMLECLHVPEEGLGLIIMKKYQMDLFDYCFTDAPKLSSSEIKKIFKQVCTGVRDLHAQGIAHLDIKPENILIDSKGNAVVCDFGCSYISNTRTKYTLQGRGTQSYQAPEVRVSGQYDPFKADIYSLGTLLHVLVTGFFANVGDLSYASQHVDQNCFSLLTMLLEISPEERVPTLDKVLKHKYFQEGKKVTRSLSDKLPKFLRR